VVTHDARDVAALDASVVVLGGGRTVQRGTLRELREAPANDFVAEFVEAGHPSTDFDFRS
jgi:ABC-type proline/glycine betaine transport system ATPase subunit